MLVEFFDVNVFFDWKFVDGSNSSQRSLGDDQIPVFSSQEGVGSGVNVATLLAFLQVQELHSDFGVKQISDSGYIFAWHTAFNVALEEREAVDDLFVLLVLLSSPVRKHLIQHSFSLLLVHHCILVNRDIFTQYAVNFDAISRSDVWELHEWISQDPTELHQVLRELNQSKDVEAVKLLHRLAHSEFSDQTNHFLNANVDVRWDGSQDFLEVVSQVGILVNLLLIEETTHVGHQKTDWLDLSNSAFDCLGNTLLHQRRSFDLEHVVQLDLGPNFHGDELFSLSKDARNLFAHHGSVDELIEDLSVFLAHVSNILSFSKELTVEESWHDDADDHEEAKQDEDLLLFVFEARGKSYAYLEVAWTVWVAVLREVLAGRVVCQNLNKTNQLYYLNLRCRPW